MSGVGLLGLGAMGAPMAERLIAAGVEPVLWNRSAPALAAFEGRASIAAVPADAAAPIVITVLTDLDGVTAVLEGPRGLRAGWRAAGVEHPMLVIMGTVSPVAVRALAESLAEQGIHVVDAPVSGGVVGARDGTLSIMIGGEPEHVDTVLPVLEHLGTTLRRMGPVGAGQLTKACNQLIVAAGCVAISESMLLARRSGLDLPFLADILEGGLAGSALLRQKGHLWLDDDFTPGGSAANQLKDLRFAADAAASVGLDLPLASVVRGLFDDMVAGGDGGLDHTGVYRELERQNPAGGILNATATTHQEEPHD